jgi:hypothetical protein
MPATRAKAPAPTGKVGTGVAAGTTFDLPLPHATAKNMAAIAATKAGHRRPARESVNVALLEK